MKSITSSQLAISALLLLAQSSAHADTNRDNTSSSNRDRQAYQRDNTAVNERDRNEKQALTADQQSNEKGPLQVTKQIRQAIVKREDLSSYARNVKIITNEGGLVTLRGPVRTEQERALLGQIAMDIAGRDLVKNEIEVAPEKKKS